MKSVFKVTLGLCEKGELESHNATDCTVVCKTAARAIVVAEKTENEGAEKGWSYLATEVIHLADIDVIDHAE